MLEIENHILKNKTGKKQTAKVTAKIEKAQNTIYVEDDRRKYYFCRGQRMHKTRLILYSPVLICPKD